VASRKMTATMQRERAEAIYAALRREYPGVRCTLDYKTPLQLLIMTILAAQCTDARVNIVAKALFRKYRKAEDFLAVPIEELQEDIRTAGFFRQKAKSIVNTCRQLVERHKGRVPGTMEELTRLPGVGRKTANVLLGECFRVQGVIVDTHCTRLAQRLGFTRKEDPVKIEKDLMKLWPPDRWTLFSHLMVFHGRAVCKARGPKCSQCVVNAHCPFPDSREGRAIAK